MHKDLDGSPLPSLHDFWEEWRKVLYAAARNQLRALGRKCIYDDVMDMVTVEFAMRYEAYRESYHPDNGLVFSNYVVYSMKRNVFKAVTVRSNNVAVQLEETFDVVDPRSLKTIVDEVDWERFTEDERWVLQLLISGNSLRDIQGDFCDITYSELRRIKSSIISKLDGIK